MDTQIIQFSSGNSPAECSWVVAQVLKQFLKEIENKNYKHQIIAKVAGEFERTLKSVIIQIYGNELNSFLENWIGSILWIGNSPYRPNHKRKNWFIVCSKIQQKNYVNFLEKDIAFQAIRSSGPGGQHANKVSSAVRATHKKTGLQVLVSDSRSQYQNKALALQRLKGKFIQFQLEQISLTVHYRWQQQTKLERGNPIKTFKGNTIAPKVKKEKYNRRSHNEQWKKELRNNEY